MYPRVKVREETRDDHDSGRQVPRKSPRSPPLGLKALDFLSIHDYQSPEQQHRVVFAECIARIPNSSASNAATRTNSMIEGKKDTSSNEDNKAQIRASSIPRPRAVLSSPDNDAMIGKKNRKATEHSSAPRNHNKLHNKNAHLQLAVPIENINTDASLKCTVPIETVNVNSSTGTRKPKGPAANNNSKHATPRVKKESASTNKINGQTCLRAGNPNIARF
ncbi:uncharacterized protein LOC116209473 [Punica granatum]|nr:uncharacterized protein LOC116209473 [Punica granatum]